MSISEADLAGLSDEEREALDGSDDRDEKALLQAILNDDDEDDDEGEEEDDGDEVQNAAPNASDPGIKQDLSPFHPVYQANPVPDYAERMALIESAHKEIATGYENGDFDLDEYQTRQRKLMELEWQLREAKLKESLAAEQRQQGMAQRWQWEQDRFFGMANNKAYRADPVIGQAFSTAVQLLAADGANDDKPMGWFLEEADRITRARFRVNPEPVAKPSKSRAAIPPTLGGLPAAAIPDMGGDEFANLDRLEGMDLERALARLSDAEADRYLMARAA